MSKPLISCLRKLADAKVRGYFPNVLRGARSLMNDELAKLIERARSVRMSSHDCEEQRRSFAYGNTKIENDRITREMVSERAEAMKRSN